MERLPVFPKCTKGTGTELAEAAIKHELVVMPGMVFSQQDTHFRISYGVPDEALQRGIGILNRLAESATS